MIEGDTNVRRRLIRRFENEVESHHLVPRARHRTQRCKRRPDANELPTRVVGLCRPCHKQIHSVLDERELESRYDTVEKLRAHPEIARFVAWIRKRPEDTTVVSHPTRERALRCRRRSI